MTTPESDVRSRSPETQAVSSLSWFRRLCKGGSVPPTNEAIFLLHCVPSTLLLFFHFARDGNSELFPVFGAPDDALPVYSSVVF